MSELENGDTTIGLLGPVILVSGDNHVTTRSALLRTLLALLALQPGSVVDDAAITEELWGDALPQDPRAALHVLVARLRKWLASGSVDATIDHDHGGYVLRVAPDAIDLHQFRADARATIDGRDAAARLAASERALARWRGEPFTGCVPGVTLEIEADRIRELQLQLAESRCDALLGTGHHVSAIPELRALLTQHPLRERLAMLAMLALYRDGRQHEALTTFQATRSALLDCGLEPGHEIVDLERRILQQSDDLVPTATPVASPPPDPRLPRPSLVGRRRELDAVKSCLRGAGGAVVLVAGAAGTGKSTFVRSVAYDAASSDVRVAIGSWEGDRSPFAAWLAVLVQIGVDVAELRGRVGEPLADVVRERLRDAVRTGPVLVVFDDVHLADASSLALLTALADHGLPDGVVVIVAARDPDVAPRPEWLAARAVLARSARVTDLVLGALDDADVHELVGLALGDDSDGSIAEVVLERTGGHPLHVAALLDVVAPHASTEARLAAAADVPASLRHLVRAQLGALPPDGRDVVEALAVLGPTSVDLLARVAGHNPLDTARLLRPAIEVGLVVDEQGVVEMRHTITADTVVDAVPSSVRAVLHRACLDELDRVGADPFRRLRHATGAASVLSPAQLATVQLEAGVVAYERGAHAEAIALLDSAAPHLEGDAAVVGTLHRGLAHAALGATAVADDLLDAALDAAGDDIDPGVLVTAAVGDELFGLQVGGDARRLARLRRAELRTRGVHSAARARLLRALVGEERLSLELDRASAALDELATLADLLDSDVERVHVAVLRTRDWLNDGPDDVHTQKVFAEQLYEAAAKVGEPALRLNALEYCIATSVMTGDVEHARDYLWELSRAATRTRRPRSLWTAAVVESALLHATGDETAAARAAAASALGTRLGVRDALGALGAFVAVDRWTRGELHEVRVVADMAMDTYPGVAAWMAVAAAACAQGGEADEAARLLEGYVTARAAAGFRLFDKAGLAMAATAAAMLGDVDMARTVRDALVPDDREVVIVGIGAAVLGPLSLFAGVVSAVAGEPEVAARQLAAARALAVDAGWTPWEQAATHAESVLLGEAPVATPYTLGLRTID